MKASDARVLLTGAGGGIGQAAALALAAAGAQLRALELRVPALQADWQQADLLDADFLQMLAARAKAWDANVVVHGAGIAQFGHFEDTQAAAMARVLDTNLRAPMLLTQLLLPHLRGLGRSQVIFVGSALGAIALPGFGVYCASKFRLRGFAQALRRELAATPVRVQYLGPRTAFNSSAVEHYTRATGTATDAPELVAAALLRLMESESAERFLGFPEKLAVRINGFAPVALDGAFAKHRKSLPEQRPPAVPHVNEEMKNAL